MRIPDVEWGPSQRIAGDRGETVTDVVRRSLRRYIREFGDDDDVAALLLERIVQVRRSGLLRDREDLDALLDELLHVIRDFRP